MNFALMLMAVVLLILSLIAHFNKHIFKDGHFRAALGASLVSSIVFSAIAVVFKVFGILNFDETQTIGIIIKGIPLEQYLLNFSFSFTAITLFQYLNIQFPNNDLQKYSLALSNLLLGLCIAFLFFGYPKWYTVPTFAILLIVLFLIEYVGKLRFMYRAYRTFLLMLIPFYLIYGFLYWNQHVLVAKNQLVGMYVFTVPIENHFLTLSMLLLSIYMFEFFKSKNAI